MSRPRKPQSVKTLAGTAIQNFTQIEAIPPSMETPPETFTDEQKALWADLYKRMDAAGILTESDIPALEVLTKIRHKILYDPTATVADMKAFLAALSMFGCTPTTRQNIAPVKKKQESAIEKLRKQIA